MIPELDFGKLKINNNLFIDRSEDLIIGEEELKENDQKQ